MTRAVLITGPSGAGKSTTSKRLLERVTGEWAYIAQDDIRDLVKAGYSSANGMPSEWSEATKRQYAVSIPICCDLIKRYTQTGIHVVCDFFASPDEFDAWRHELKGVDAELFVLVPNIETTVQQNQERTGTARLTDEKVAYNHNLFTQDTIEGATYINSTELAVDEVVDQILGE